MVQNNVDQYYTEKPTSDLREFEFCDRYCFYSASGVFSKDHIDRGSEVLIDNCKVNDGDSVLDLGCGIGVVSVCVGKKFKIDITAVDVNERALFLCKKNLKKNKVSGKVLKSDVYSNVGMFDVILVNPPQRAGKETIFKMVSEAPSHLNDCGTFQAVMRTQKGGKSFKKKVIEVFGNCEVIGRGSGYSVYYAKK